jgi:chemotaxis signal transduction protein
MAGTLLIEAGGRTFAVPLEYVVEVLALGDLTPVPAAPSAVRGIASVRGQIAAVLDTAALAGEPPTEPRPGEPLVLAAAPAREDAPSMRAALWASRVIGIGDGSTRAERQAPSAAAAAVTATVLDVPAIFDGVRREAARGAGL